MSLQIFPRHSFRLRNFDGALREEIAELCKRTGLPDAPNMTTLELANALDAMWVKSGVERWEGSDQPIDPELLELFHGQEFTEELWPSSFRRYDHTIVLGATLRPQARKAELLARLAATHGYSLGTIWHVGADDRELLQDRENFEQLLTQKEGELPRQPGFHWAEDYNTEIDMMAAMWNCLELPTKLREAPARFIPVTKVDGRRANTGDGLRAWLDEAKPQRGSNVVIVSINPSAADQFWNAEYVLNGGVKKTPQLNIQMAAPSAWLGPQRLDYYMRALAKWVRYYLLANEGVDIDRAKK